MSVLNPCPNAAFFISAQAGQSVIAYGLVGVAKNALIEAVIGMLNYTGHIFIPSQHAPEDIGGIPFHDPATNQCRMIAMDWMSDLELPRRWLHIDELTTAPTQMRPPLLSCFQERRVGKLKFHPTTVVTGAANPPELAPNGSPLEAALCNRLYHHEWVFPSDLWHKGLRAGGNFPVPSEFPVVGNFDHLLPKWGGLTSRLLTNKPSLANTERVHEGMRAFPTPRSWWNLCRCLAAAESVGYLEECRSELATGLVGAGAGAELLNLADKLTMHNVEGIADGSETVKVDESRFDILLSLPSALCIHLAERKKRDGSVDPDVLDRCYDVMVRIGENDQPDSAIPALAEMRREFPNYQPPAKLAARHGKLATAIYGGGR